MSASEHVREFHEAYRQPIHTGPPTLDIGDRLHLRLGLIAEELAELVGATYGPQAEQVMVAAFQQARLFDAGTRDLVEVADALGDLVYVIEGMALETGIPLEAVVDEIHHSNMSKLGENGEPIYRSDRKVMKGPNYQPPDIPSVLLFAEMRARSQARQAS